MNEEKTVAIVFWTSTIALLVGALAVIFVFFWYHSRERKRAEDLERAKGKDFSMLK